MTDRTYHMAGRRSRPPDWYLWQLLLVSVSLSIVGCVSRTEAADGTIVFRHASWVVLAALVPAAVCGYVAVLAAVRWKRRDLVFKSGSISLIWLVVLVPMFGADYVSVRRDGFESRERLMHLVSVDFADCQGLSQEVRRRGRGDRLCLVVRTSAGEAIFDADRGGLMETAAPTITARWLAWKLDHPAVR